MTKWTGEQLEAITKEGTNIIVSAGAGSGKTAVLSERVIHKLKEKVNINELLILTFTNAAAFEMKERIRKKIMEESSLKDQLDLIDTAYITTFDSFALSIVKKYHYIYNISPDVSIIDSNIINVEKKKVLDNIFSKLYQKKDEKFLKLIKDFCNKNDKEIKNAILSINSKLDLKVDKIAYLNNYINTYFSDEFINDSIKEYIDILLSKIESLKNSLSYLKTYDSDYYEKVIEVLTPLLESNNYDNIKINSSVTLPRLPNNSSDDLKKLKEDITNILKDIDRLTKYENILELKEEYLRTKPYIEAIIYIIKELEINITSYKQKYDLYEFNDIAVIAINIIKNNVDIKEELKNTFKEIMIDEYQDTNDLQEIFISLISSNNVYTVGDIKQSIYRFRNANPSNFKNKYDTYKNSNLGYKIDLNKNFRSRKEVVGDINKIFNQIMSDEIGKADYIKEHQMVFGNTTYEQEKANQDYGLKIYNYEKLDDYNNDEIEAFIIADDIKKKLANHYQILDKETNKLRDVTLSDFVILIDRSSNFETYKKIFEYLNIPTYIEKDEDITDEVEINIIKNILNFIIKIKNNELDTEFKYYFISIGRSFLFEYSDQEIFDCFKTNDFKNNEIYKKAYQLSLDIDILSIAGILNRIIDEFDITSNLIKIGDIEKRTIRINYLFDIASNVSKIGYDIYKYTSHLTDIINGSDKIKFSLNIQTEDSIKITTIHKSKGLEYSICYFPGFDKKFNISDLKERFLYDDTYGIITPYFNEGVASTFYKELLINKYIKEEISEKIRLLYVAFTRAKENMIIVTNLKENFLTIKNDSGIIDDNIRLNYRSFNDIIFSIYNSLKNYIINYNLEDINLSKKYKQIKKFNYNKYIPKTNDKVEVSNIDITNEYTSKQVFSKHVNDLITNDDLDNMKLGTYMHYLLEMIDFKNPNLEDLNIDKFYKDKIIRFLNNDILKDINKAKIYKEYEFMYEDSSNTYHGIIDLMLEYDSHIDIIDYKLKNILDEHYLEQLKGYKNYIYGLTKKEVNIYLYSIIDGVLKKLL